MAQKQVLDEKKLSRAEQKKLNALRKLVDKPIADKAFEEWLSTTQGADAAHRDASRIALAIAPLIERNEVRIPRGGYLVRRGKGRVIVEPARPQSRRSWKSRLNVFS